MDETIKNIFDAIALPSVVGFIFGNFVPFVLGVLSVVWTIYRIQDMRLSIQLKKKQLKE